MSESNLQISDAYLSALNEAKNLIRQSQEKFLRSDRGCGEKLVPKTNILMVISKEVIKQT